MWSITRDSVQSLTRSILVVVVVTVTAAVGETEVEVVEVKTSKLMHLSIWSCSCISTTVSFPRN